MRLIFSTLTGMLCFVLLFSGCEKRFDSLEELDAWYRSADSPFVQSVVKNGIKVTARYMPTEAMLIPQLKRYEEKKQTVWADTTLSQTARDSLLVVAQGRLDEQREIYDRSLYFALTIGFEDGERDIIYQGMQAGFGNYSDWLQKLLFQLKEQIFLRTASGEEIPLDTYHMERSYGMTKDRTLLLMFPARFNERAVWGYGSETLILVLKECGLNIGLINICFRNLEQRLQPVILNNLNM